MEVVIKKEMRLENEVVIFLIVLKIVH